MEDYYELLEIEKSWAAEEVDSHLMRLNRKYRARTNHRDAMIREEAIDQLALISRAMVHIGPEADRGVYDQALANYQAEQELNQPMSDVDLYQALELDESMTAEQLEQILDARATNLDEENGDDTIRRVQKLIDLAHQVLLDPQKRKEYDEQLSQKREFAKARDAIEPVPLHVNGSTVDTWLALESVLETHPHEGLDLLQDGEIEAWVRWSLGEKQRANHILNLAERAKRSVTPFMEYQEFLRLINGNRPLILYPKGMGPKETDAVTVHRAVDIPTLADQEWQLFVTQLDYVVDWLAQYAAPDLIDELATYGDTDNAEVTLERLIATIAPDHPNPKAVLQDIKGYCIKFGDVNAWSTPTHTFTIRQQGRGYLYGQLHTTADWLKIEPSSFSGEQTSVVVTADRQHMQSGKTNAAEVVIELLDGRAEPLRIDVSAHQKTVWQSVTGFFGGRR